MGQVLAGRRGKILGLRALLDEYEEAIASDLLDRGRSIHEIGVSVDWWEFRSWLRHLTPTNSAYARIRAHEAAEEAKPEHERAVGGKGDALTIGEMNKWLKWDDTEEVTSGG